MKNNKLLVKQIAESFIKDPDSVDLSTFTSIAADAAEILAAYKGSKLRLYGLRQLSSEAADFLARFNGKIELDSLWLNYDEQISGHVALAAKQAEHNGCFFGHDLYRCPRCSKLGCMWDRCRFVVVQEYSPEGPFEHPHLCVHCGQGEHGGEYIKL
jgi:hypothetical protein